MWQRLRNTFIPPPLPKPLFRKTCPELRHILIVRFLVLALPGKMPRLVADPAFAAAAPGAAPPAMVATVAGALPVTASSLVLALIEGIIGCNQRLHPGRELLHSTDQGLLQAVYLVRYHALFPHLLDCLAFVFLTLEPLCTRHTFLHGRLQEEDRQDCS